MAIEITEFTDVSISVSPVGAQGGNFGILGFLTKFSDTATNPISPSERTRAYTGLSSVAGDWPATSEVYKAATAFYSQTPSPTDFVVLMNYDVAQPAKLIGGSHELFAELLLIGAGDVSLTVDGALITATGIDLSGAADLDAMAATLSTALTPAVVTYGKYGFEVTSPTAGVSSTITAATGEAAESLGLLAYQAKVGNGVAIEGVVESLAAVSVLGTKYVGLVLHKDFRDILVAADAEDNMVAIGSFAAANKRIFMNTTNALATIGPVSGPATVADELKSSTNRYVLTSFSKNPSLYPSAAVFGRAATVNFSGVNTTLTMNLKQLSGVTAENLTPAEYANLKSRYCSAVVQIGKSVNAYTDSRMASGSWLDTTHGLLWLENRCEVDLFNLLYQSTTKIPFTNSGINTVVATLDRSLAAAVRNGLAASGYLPDGTFLPEGYRITAPSLEDIPSGDKGNRLLQGLTFDMVGAGALHEVTVSGNFSE